MKRKTLLLLLLVATVAGVALAGSSIGRNADAGNRHILVAYFSATGNTKSVAETASTVLNADLLRILPAEPYTEDDLGHGADARVTQEQYDTVLIGYPIWGGTAPRIINTFIDSYDFAGKRVAFFCTSGSSGIEDSEAALKEQLHGADVLSGARFEPDATVADIRTWAAEAGIQ